MAPRRRDARHIIILLSMAVLLATAGEADAGPRPDDAWSVGVSLGVGTGGATDGQGETLEAEGGISPQIRVARAVAPRLLAGLEYEGWLIEQGDLEHKFRRSLQTCSLAATWFPARAEGPLGGFFVRAGGGIAWGSRAEVGLTFDDEEESIVQDHGHRDDEWGWGLVLGVGHQWRLSRRVAVGLTAAYDYLAIGETWYDTAWFRSATVDLSWYF